MINKLTQKQTDALARYRDAGTQRALSAKCDPQKARAANLAFYAAAKLAEPATLHLNNPLDCLWLLTLMTKRGDSVGNSVYDSVDASVRDSVDASVYDSVANSVRASVANSVRASVDASVYDSVYDSVDDSVYDSVYASVRASVDASVYDSVDASVYASVRASVGDSVANSVRASVDASVGASVYASVYASVGASVGASVYASVDASVYASVRASVDASVDASVRMLFFYPHYCAGWAGYSAWVRFYIEQLGIANEGQPYLDAADSGAFWFVGIPGLALSCDPPEMHFDAQEIEQNNLYTFHRDGGPALSWDRDYARWYFLHGVSVPEWLATIPAQEIDPKRFAEIKNAEVRREFIRKLGIERIITDLPHKVLDTSGDYSLLEVDLRDGIKGRYLKMRNPSIGVWHIEGVAPECETVQGAINWRTYEDTNKPWKPEQLT